MGVGAPDRGGELRTGAGVRAGGLVGATRAGLPDSAGGGEGEVRPNMASRCPRGVLVRGLGWLGALGASVGVDLRSR